MSAATATIIAGVSIAASTAAAAAQHKAAGKAAAQQSAAADKALAAQQQGYNQQRADFSPYQQAGYDAVAHLKQTAGTYTGGMPQGGQLSGLSQPPQVGQGPPPPMGQQAPPQGGGTLSSLGAPQGQSGFMGQLQGMAQQAQGQPQAGPSFLGPQGGMSPQMGQAVAQQPGGGPQPGALVRVRAPNGQEASLPAEMAKRAVEKGATVIP